MGVKIKMNSYDKIQNKINAKSMLQMKKAKKYKILKMKIIE